MTESPTSLPEARNIPSIDSLETREDIQEWVDGFFQKLGGLLPDEISNNSEHPAYTCETSLDGGVYRFKGGVTGVSEFDFPGQVRNCLIRVVGNVVEGWFPGKNPSLAFSFRTDRMKKEDIARIGQSLESTQLAFDNLTQANTGVILWKVDGGKEIRQVNEDTRQATAEVLAG